MIRFLFTQDFAAYFLLCLFALWQFGEAGLLMVVLGLVLLAGR